MRIRNTLRTNEPQRTEPHRLHRARRGTDVAGVARLDEHDAEIAQAVKRHARHYSDGPTTAPRWRNAHAVMANPAAMPNGSRHRRITSMVRFLHRTWHLC